MHKSKRIAKASYLIQIKLLRQFGDVHRDPPRFVARRRHLPKMSTFIPVAVRVTTRPAHLSRNAAGTENTHEIGGSKLLPSRFHCRFHGSKSP